MLEQILNSSFLYSLSLTLLHFLWQGLLVALVLKSALLIVNDKKPQLRYALSTLAMIVNLCLPIITFNIIYSAELALSSTSNNVLLFNGLIQELQQPDLLLSYQGLTELLPVILPYISILWLAAVILLASKLLLEIYNVNNLPKQNSVEPTEVLLARFNELATQLKLTIKPKLLISLKVDVPMAIGWLKPVVLIPATMVSGLNTAQLEMLILHELAHIRRHDYIVNFIQTFVEILLFFHPGVLWVSKQMRNEREYCSDDIAVQHCGDAVAYAHTLADTASICKSHRHTIPSMAMAASGGDLKQRVIRLVDHHCAPQNSISKWAASATIVLSILLLSSKQLLTMPLLNIWHEEVPFNKIKHANAQDEQIQNDTELFDSKLPTESIAKQLLTPQPVNNSDEKYTNNTPIQLVLVDIDTENTIKQAETKSEKVLLADKPLNNNTDFSNASKVVLTTSQVNTNASKEVAIDNQILSIESTTVEGVFEQAQSKSPLVSSHEPDTQQVTKLSTINIEEKETSSQKVAFKIEQPSSLKQQDNNLVASKRHEQSLIIDSVEQSIMAELANKNMPVRHNAKQVKSVDPIYPSIAKRRGIEIEIKVDFTIDVDGTIKDIQFSRKNKINYFKNSIRSAIKQWRFLPAKVNEQPVESQMSKVFAFSLQS